MTLSIHTLQPKKGSRRNKKRVGRGLGSTGSYSGRGVKGQRARSGGRGGLKLFGLRALMLATPKKRGFVSSKVKSVVLNVQDLAKAFTNGAKVNPRVLIEKGLISDTAKSVKILGKGEITIKLTVEDCELSSSAKEKIEQAGGVILAKK